MQTVERIVSVIETVANSPSGLTLSEISRECNLSTTTCHRVLAALTACHLLERNGDSRRYRVGVGLQRLAASVTAATDFSVSVQRALETLRDRWQECFYLAALVDGEVVCVDSAGTTDPHKMGVYLTIGRRLVPHVSAGSRAILAGLKPEEAERVMRAAGYDRFTSQTRTDPAEIREELSATRDRGYAICDQELELGAIAYAVAIQDAGGRTTRSLGVIGPRERLRGERDAGLLDDLVSSARSLSGIARREHPTPADR